MKEEPCVSINMEHSMLSVKLKSLVSLKYRSGNEAAYNFISDACCTNTGETGSFVWYSRSLERGCTPGYV